MGFEAVTEGAVTGSLVTVLAEVIEHHELIEPRVGEKVLLDAEKLAVAGFVVVALAIDGDGCAEFADGEMLGHVVADPMSEVKAAIEAAGQARLFNVLRRRG